MAKQNTNLSLSASRQNSTLGDNNQSTSYDNSMRQKQQDDFIEKRRTTWNVPVLQNMMKGASALFQLRNSQDDVTRRHSLNTLAHHALSANDANNLYDDKSQAANSASSRSHSKKTQSLVNEQMGTISKTRETDGAQKKSAATAQDSIVTASGEDLEGPADDIDVSSNDTSDSDLEASSGGKGEAGSEGDSSDDDSSSSGESSSNSSDSSDSDEDSNDEGSSSEVDSSSDDSDSSYKKSSSKAEELAANERQLGLGRGMLSQTPLALGTQICGEPLDSDSTPFAETAPDLDTNGAGLLPAFSQGDQSDLFSQALMRMPQDDQIYFVGPGTAADLMILDYLSQRVLDEVDVLERLLEDSSTALDDNASAEDVDQVFQRLDSLAREHTLMRRNHFSSELFLTNEQRPADEADVVQWAVALHRINLATFALLIFRPQLTVIESVGKNMPNREWLLASLGFEEASNGFFAHIVPANRCDADAIGLLVDMQTQQWLMAATNESHLQSMVADARRASDTTIYNLLGIDAEENKHAGKIAAATYRTEIGRRLNKISGGKLTITRAQYTLHDVWKRAAHFCGTCTQAMSPPVLLSGRFKNPDSGEVSDIVSEPDGEQEINVKSQSSIEGDFEVTVYTDHIPERKKTQGPNSPETHEPPAELAVEVQEPAVQHTLENDAGPIDPSFSEERRLAVVLRDALDDAHLNELMEHITAEHIDIEQDQASSHTPRRMHMLRSRRISVSPAPQQLQQEHNYVDDDANLHFDDSKLSSADEAAQPASKPNSGTSSKHELPLIDRAVAGAASKIIKATREPVERKRPNYAEQKSPSVFRGRRGIPAENLADLRTDVDADRIKFTPSAPGTPEPVGDSKIAAPEQDVDLAALGQYRPLQLVSREKRARRASSESDTESESEQQRRGTRRKRRNRKWSAEEEECLIRAVFEHGLRWSLIEEYHGTNGIVDQTLRGRTRFNIKDKARTIKLRLMREGKPLGPFANATGHL